MYSTVSHTHTHTHTHNAHFYKLQALTLSLCYLIRLWFIQIDKMKTLNNGKRLVWEKHPESEGIALQFYSKIKYS